MARYMLQNFFAPPENFGQLDFDSDFSDKMVESFENESVGIINIWDWISCIEDGGDEAKVVSTGTGGVCPVVEFGTGEIVLPTVDIGTKVAWVELEGFCVIFNSLFCSAKTWSISSHSSLTSYLNLALASAIWWTSPDSCWVALWARQIKHSCPWYLE